VTGYGLDGQGVIFHSVKNGSGAHPASYTMDTEGCFTGSNATGWWSCPFNSIKVSTVAFQIRGLSLRLLMHVNAWQLPLFASKQRLLRYGWSPQRKPLVYGPLMESTFWFLALAIPFTSNDFSYGLEDKKKGQMHIRGKALRRRASVTLPIQTRHVICSEISRNTVSFMQIWYKTQNAYFTDT
jgi:hypothetical protein